MQEIMLVNPSRRGARKRRHGRKARRRNPHRARRSSRSRFKRYSNPHRARKHVMRRRRRNPVAMSMSVRGLKGFFMPALWGGTGAVITDIAYRLLPVPGALAMLKGPLAPVTKIAVAFGTAQLAKMMLGANTAKEMLNGSLAVIAYGLLNDLVLSRIPVLSAPVAGYELAGLGYTSPGMAITGSGNMDLVPGMAEYVSGVGEYVSGYEMAGA